MTSKVPPDYTVMYRLDSAYNPPRMIKLTVNSYNKETGLVSVTVCYSPGDEESIQVKPIELKAYSATASIAAKREDSSVKKSIAALVNRKNRIREYTIRQAGKHGRRD